MNRFRSGRDRRASITRLERNLQFANRPKQAVEAEVRKPLDCPLLAPPPHGVDHVESLSPALNELGDHLRRILEIAVHDHYSPAPRVI
jgi:hypothetical protein